MRHWKLSLGAFIAGCVLLAAAVSHSAQPAVGLGGSRSRSTAGNSPVEEESGKVKPVDPTPAQSEKIANLIEQLGAPTLRERDTAMSALAEFGATAIKQVKEAQKHDDDEIGHRCTILLEVLYSGKAELFLAARRLGMTDKELEQQLAASDPSPLLQTLEQNAGAGMGPIWARVLAALAPAASRYPAALSCRRAEGIEGYGAVLAKAARDPETRKNPQRSSGLVAMVSLLPPQRAEHVVLTLASLAAADQPLARITQIDEALRAARALRGIYDAASCLQALRESNEKLLIGGDGTTSERLLHAIVLALAPSATEAQLDAARLPATANMTIYELDEFASLCARSGLIAKLGKLLVETQSAGAQSNRRTSVVAHAFARCGQPALEAFDNLPNVAQLAMLDAWWFSPPPAMKLQPFLCARLASMAPAVRVATAALLAGYRALSTAKALAECVLAFDDTASAVLESLAPMSDLLPLAAPQALTDLLKGLETADARVRGPLIDCLANSGAPEAKSALWARWRKNLPMNELGRAMRFLSHEQGTAAGAYCAACLLWASRMYPSDTAYLLQYVGHVEWTMLRTLLARNDSAGFALIEGLAADPWANGSGEALIALALAGKDSRLAPEVSRLYGAGNDPRHEYVQQFLALSETPAGEEFRTRARKLSIESPDLVSLIVAVNYKRGGTITRESLLRDLAEKPGDFTAIPPLVKLLAAGDLPAPFVRALGTHVLLERDTNYPLLARDEALLLRTANIDVVRLFYGAQPEPKPRTPVQLVATAALGNAAAAEIVARADVAKDGSNFEWRECARAYVGLLPQAHADALLRSPAAAPFHVFSLLRSAQAGDVAALRYLLDSYSARGFWHGPEGYASVAGGSRYRGDGASIYGAAGAAFAVPLPLEQSALSALLVRSVLGQEFRGEFEYWWCSRRGLLEKDSKSGKLRLTEIP